MAFYINRGQVWIGPFQNEDAARAFEYLSNTTGHVLIEQVDPSDLARYSPEDFHDGRKPKIKPPSSSLPQYGWHILEPGILIYGKFRMTQSGLDELKRIGVKEKSMKTKAVIAVDLHRTLMNGPGPNFDKPPIEGAREAMQKLADAGHDIAVWTVGDTEGARNWLTENNIYHDWVNWSPLTPEDTDSGKIRADAYVDDKAVLFDGDWYKTADDVLDQLQRQGRKSLRIKSLGDNPVVTKSAATDAEYRATKLVNELTIAAGRTACAKFGQPEIKWNSDGISGTVTVAVEPKGFQFDFLSQLASKHKAGWDGKQFSFPFKMSVTGKSKSITEIDCPNCAGSECTQCGGTGKIQVVDDKKVKSDTRSTIVQAIREVGDWAEDHEGRMSGYGNIYLQNPLEPGEGYSIWYVGGDDDTKEFYKECKAKLEAIPNVDSTQYEAEEFPPDDGKWEQVYPEDKEEKSKGRTKAISIPGYDVVDENYPSTWKIETWEEPDGDTHSLKLEFWTDRSSHYAEFSGDLTGVPKNIQDAILSKPMGGQLDKWYWEGSPQYLRRENINKLASKILQNKDTLANLLATRKFNIFHDMILTWADELSIDLTKSPDLYSSIKSPMTALANATDEDRKRYYKEQVNDLYHYIRRVKSKAESHSHMSINKTIWSIKWDSEDGKSRSGMNMRGGTVYINDGHIDSPSLPNDVKEAMEKNPKEGTKEVPVNLGPHMEGKRIYTWKGKLISRSKKHSGSIRKGLGHLLSKDDTGAEFIVSTEAPDRDGDTVDQDSLDWTEFDNNPVATLSHDTDEIPVGKWDPSTRKIIEIEDPASGKNVKATSMYFVFNPHTEKGREVAGSVKDDFLGAASVSFLPQDEGTEKNDSGGSYYKNAKVTEVAVCAVPANQGATRRVMALMKSLKTVIDTQHCVDDSFRYQLRNEDNNAIVHQADTLDMINRLKDTMERRHPKSRFYIVECKGIKRTKAFQNTYGYTVSVHDFRSVRHSDPEFHDFSIKIIKDSLSVGVGYVDGNKITWVRTPPDKIQEIERMVFKIIRDELGGIKSKANYVPLNISTGLVPLDSPEFLKLTRGRRASQYELNNFSRGMYAVFEMGVPILGPYEDREVARDNASTYRMFNQIRGKSFAVVHRETDEERGEFETREEAEYRALELGSMWEVVQKAKVKGLGAANSSIAMANAQRAYDLAKKRGLTPTRPEIDEDENIVFMEIPDASSLTLHAISDQSNGDRVNMGDKSINWEYVKKSKALKGSAMKFWRKSRHKGYGGIVRVLKDDLDKIDRKGWRVSLREGDNPDSWYIINQETGRIIQTVHGDRTTAEHEIREWVDKQSEDNQLDRVAETLKAEELKVVEEEPKAEDLIGWAEEEMQEEEHKSLMLLDPKNPLSRGGWSIVDSRSGNIVQGPFQSESTARSIYRQVARSKSEEEEFTSKTEELVEAGMEEEEAKRLAWKMLKKRKSKKFKVRVGKRWVKNLDSDVELVEEDEATVMSKDEAEAVADEVGGEVEMSKSYRRNKRFEGELPGKRFLKSIVAAIKAGLDEGQENDRVIQAAEKMLKIAEETMNKAYGKDEDTSVEKEVCADCGMEDCDCGVKSKKLRHKALNKTQKGIVKEATEVLDDLAGSSDMPKRYKGSIAGVSMRLKDLVPDESVIQQSKEEEDKGCGDGTKDFETEEMAKDGEAKLTPEEEEQLTELTKSLEHRMDSLDTVMFRFAGQQYKKSSNRN